MGKHAGETQAVRLEQSSTPAAAGMQATVSEKSILGSSVKTHIVQTPPARKTSLSCATASSSPVAASPFAGVAAVAHRSPLEAADEQQGTLPIEPCFLVSECVSGPSTTPAEPNSAAAIGLLSEQADDLLGSAVPVVARAAEAEALAAAAATEALLPAAPLTTRSFGALRAWEAAKAAAAAAASAAATTVAATDFSGLSEATASVLAAAGGGLGAVGGLSTVLPQRQGDTKITSESVEGADRLTTPESAQAAHQQRSRVTGNAGNKSNEAGRSRLLGLLQLPTLPQWWCSAPSTSTSSAALGCPPTLADQDTELQGSEADAAAAAHMAAVAAASTVSSSIGAGTKCGPDGCADEPVKASTPNATGEARAARGGSVPLPSAENPASTSTVAIPRVLVSNVQPENPASTCRRDESTTDAPADTAGRLLQLLEDRAACAAELTSSSSSSSEGVDTSVLQQQLLQLQKATNAVLAAGPGLMQLDAAGLQSISPEAVAATAERAERVIKEQKQTAWASLLSSLAESSRRSVKAVQRVAGAATCAPGTNALASTETPIFPLFGACRNPSTHVEQDVQADESCGEQQNGADPSGRPQAEPVPVGTQAARLGVLIALQRRQQAIAEELRQRSANLLQHSVALTTSATLSEARYHLAEIVDTGGPEVSGVWAGFKVGLGIVTLASGHLLLGGAMVAVATGSLGSAVVWSRHRRLFYEMMRGNFTGTEEQPEASDTSDVSGTPVAGAQGADGTGGDNGERCGQPVAATFASSREEGYVGALIEAERPFSVGVEDSSLMPTVSPGLPGDEPPTRKDLSQSCTAQAESSFADCGEVLESALGSDDAYLTVDVPVIKVVSGELQNKDSGIC
ncbi:hypothetical protein ACSSS7_003303 [Eimeria intestinalis]